MRYIASYTAPYGRSLATSRLGAHIITSPSLYMCRWSQHSRSTALGLHRGSLESTKVLTYYTSSRSEYPPPASHPVLA